MEKISLKARAKINLTLEILDKRQDGYHNIRSVFQKIDLYDDINIYKRSNPDFELETNVEELNNKDNIIYKAYLKLKEKYKINSGVKVELIKKIPMQAGLGGGSTDCASFLLGMNKIFELNMSKDELINLGKSLGADVVPCLYNSAVLAEGIGEVITEIDTVFQYPVLIIKPEFSCNTKEMYQKLDSKTRNIDSNHTNEIMKSLISNDINVLAKNLYNSFEEVVEVGDIKKDLKTNKALGTLLSGSGSCVFGIFKNQKEAENAYDNLKKKYEVYICNSYNQPNDIFE